LADVKKLAPEVIGPGNHSGDVSVSVEPEASHPKSIPSKIEMEGGQSEALKAIIAYESTNLQYQKLAHNWLLIAFLTIISILKGPGDDSVIGTVRCTG
jgi:hypothetical protein